MHAEVLAKVEADIDSAGWAGIGVFGNEPGYVPFTYSVGLSVKGGPEFIIAGLAHETAHHILWQLADRALAGEIITEGRDDELLKDYPAELREVKDAPVNVATAYLGEKPEVLQVFWPDEAGLFPWDEGVDPKVRRQQEVTE